MARTRHRGTRCCSALWRASARAGQSGCRIRLAASCPGWGRGGRTNRARHPGVSPSSQSEDAIRAGGPAPLGWRRRRRPRRVRLGRDRSSAAGTLRRRHVSRKAAASSSQPALSRSTARKKQVSSWSSGQTPATKGCPSPSIPDRCHPVTSSVTGRRRRCAHSVHLMRGFSQRPRTHSWAQTGR
jgi:hypothetical protein